MMKFLAVLTFAFCFISEGFSQKSLSEYSFVVVPDKYEFVSEPDKYQLNSLTKFLFNKHGFNAYFNKELPDVSRCDGLWAEVNGRPGFIWTRVVIVLKDCYGQEVHRSEEGRSKLKAYDKTYSAAIRDAFLSIESLGVNQQDPTILSPDEVAKNDVEKPEIEKDKSMDTTEPGVIKDVPKVEVATKVKDEVGVQKNVPSTDTVESVYSRNGSDYILKSAKRGYGLFQKASPTNTYIGLILPGDDGNFDFVDTSGNQFPCQFDPAGNFTIKSSFENLVFTKKN